MGTSTFALTEDEGTLQICLCRESAMEEGSMNALPR